VANELQNSLKRVAEKVAQYVEDAATLTVETRCIDPGSKGGNDFSQARPAARSVIRMDGDSETIVPMVAAKQGQAEVDSALYELHERNVKAAIEYRASILQALVDTLTGRGG
jgi:hypothetical protein